MHHHFAVAGRLKGISEYADKTKIRIFSHRELKADTRPHFSDKYRQRTK